MSAFWCPAESVEWRSTAAPAEMAAVLRLRAPGPGPPQDALTHQGQGRAGLVVLTARCSCSGCVW
eukprot:12880368-Alexandrium_andersonii.AAC.1